MKLILDSTTFGEVSAMMIMGPETVFAVFGAVQLLSGCDMASPVSRGGEGVTISAQVTFKLPQTLAAAETKFLDLLEDGRLSGVLKIEASDGSFITYNSAVVTPSRIVQRGARVSCFWEVTAGSQHNFTLEPVAGSVVTAGKLLETGDYKLLETGGIKLLEAN